MDDLDGFDKKFKATLATVTPIKHEREKRKRTDARSGEEDLRQTRQLPSPNTPMAVARLFLDDECMHEGSPTLRHWHGGWWQWQRSHWIELEDRAVRSLLYGFTEDAIYWSDKKLVEWAPTRRKIGDLMEPLAAICILPDMLQQPCWLDHRETATIVAVANGLLDVGKRTLIAHTPKFFNQTSVPFDYDAAAPQPQRWREFLGMLWPSEPEAIHALSEWFGYVISGRTDLHKILLMVGRRAAAKV